MYEDDYKIVPTERNSDLSQEQPTKNECQCVWVHIPVVFSVTDVRIYRSLSHPTYKI
jgi:hypothetical protein